MSIPPVRPTAILILAGMLSRLEPIAMSRPADDGTTDFARIVSWTKMRIAVRQKILNGVQSSGVNRERQG